MKPIKTSIDPFYYKTVSGLLITLNVIIFLLMCFWDRSFLIPSQGALLYWGAANSVKIGQGEIWRVFTANFVHFGLIHIWFNAMALKIVGRQIERILDKGSFLLIYIASGLFAILSSVYFNLSTSAGASGAIFGLIGVGMVFEMLYDHRLFKEDFKKQKGFRKKLLIILMRRPFLTISLINILFSLFLNLLATLFEIKVKVDNAAHISGMFAGAFFFYSLLLIRREKASFSSKLSGALLLGLFIPSLLFGIYHMGHSTILAQAHSKAALKNDEPTLRYFHYSQALKIDPFDKEALFQRGKTALLYGDFKVALKDFRNLLMRGYEKEKFESLKEELKNEKKEYEIKLIDFILHEKTLPGNSLPQ